MANFHKNALPYIDCLRNSTPIILEFGSDQNEGSTEFFNDYAANTGMNFYSVDVVDDAKQKLGHLSNTNWVVCESGSSWAKNELPKLNKSISILYLDNYDWTNPGPERDRVTALYAKRKVEWSNMGSQVEHLAQMMYCMPYMNEVSVIICDDTPYQEHHGTFIGKCGAVVPYLIAHEYKIVYNKNNGVILAKGISSKT
jgi:hypothetical protein